MSRDTEPNEDRKSDEAAEHSLERGLHRQPLTREAELRIHAVVEAEWRASTARSSRSASRRWIALAAATVAAVVVAATWLRPAAEAAVVGQIVRVQSGGLQGGWVPLMRHTLNAGDALHAGESVVAQGAALVKLERGGTLRIAQGAKLEPLSATEIELQSGQIYVDLPPERPPVASFIIRTPFGSLEHVGTQFEVTTLEQELRVRVREGQVRVQRPNGAEVVGAGIELFVPLTGPVTRAAFGTSGRDWSWVEALAPDFDIEGQRLADFLEWGARETGRHLELADERARRAAEGTVLHGSVRGLTPIESLERVMHTTPLRFELQDDVIRVSSGG